MGKNLKPTEAKQRLSLREALFVLKVIELDNQTEAYMQAGYKCSRESARANAARLIAKDSVKEALRVAHDKRLDAAELNADDALRAVSVIARGDIRKLYRNGWEMLPPDQWPDDVAACVKSIQMTPHGAKVTFYDRLRGLEIIATAGGRLKPKPDSKQVFALEDFLRDRPPTIDEEANPPVTSPRRL